VSGPFIFIATNRLKPGKLADERKRVPGLIDFVEANEPRRIAFNEYVNDDGTQVAAARAGERATEHLRRRQQETVQAVLVDRRFSGRLRTARASRQDAAAVGRCARSGGQHHRRDGAKERQHSRTLPTGERDSHPTVLTDWREMKKPLPVAITTQVTPLNAEAQRNRPTVTEEPYGSLRTSGKLGS
jgi:hypothetical protein